MQFKEFLLSHYPLNEGSADDYVGRINGILEKGLYNGEKEMPPLLKATVEREFPRSKNHYVLTLKRYIDYQNKLESF